MPWSETSPLDQKRLFISDYQRGSFSMAELCRRCPNGSWCADFKGEFKTSDGVYCYPLTVTDGAGRFLLGCQALHSTAHETAKPVFRRLFQEYGLPRRIRSDNGVPFATTAIGRLSRLSIWWIRLGISNGGPGAKSRRACRAVHFCARGSMGFDPDDGAGVSEQRHAGS